MSANEITCHNKLVKMSEAKYSTGHGISNVNNTMNAPQGVLTAVQLDQLLSLLSYSVKNKNRTDQLANIGLETTILDQLCQKFSSIFPQKTDAFKVRYKAINIIYMIYCKYNLVKAKMYMRKL